MSVGELAFVAVVLPAYAGMIRYGPAGANRGIGAPRVCGDDPPRSDGFTIEWECSPRMRG